MPEIADSQMTEAASLRPASAASEELIQVLSALESIVPPLWPLRSYVAVNPFLGLSDQRFLSARQTLREVRDCEMLPTFDHYRDKVRSGEIARADLEEGVRRAVEEYTEFYARIHADAIAALVENPQIPPAAGERRWFAVSELVDRRTRSSWTSHILNDVTRHCGGHFDEGQASWSSPWKGLPLYTAWREAASLSYRMDQLGIPGFRKLVRELPATPTEAIWQMLHELDLPPDDWRAFLMCEIFSASGWASYVKYRVREAANAGRRDEDLIGLLAIRLAYDVALARVHPNVWRAERDKAASDDLGSEVPVAPPTDVLARYVLQVAAESAYRRNLLGQLISRKPTPSPTQRKAAQMIFCIDVRSEVMRRQLESLSGDIETFGFAGFFGMSFEYVPLGEPSGAAQCPVLLQPGFQIQEAVTGASQDQAVQARHEQRTWRKVWKSFRSSAVSCFSFVESLGLFYVAKLLTDSLGMTRPVSVADRDGLPKSGNAALAPDVHTCGSHALPFGKKIDLAEGMLRNLGLTAGFAKIVAVCGHGSDVVNNPYKAGLDCGACGGNSGEPNARVAAALLNDPEVRNGLAGRGIAIPSDTWFVPAVHNTTTDDIRLFDTAAVPTSLATDLAQLRTWIEEAGRLCRTERGMRLNTEDGADLIGRSRDWSEVRPEWGLAGNSAFIVAPRSRTAGLDLGGRTFMHSYDQAKDPELKILELIMTAPMVVTSWINLQYYASAVDNRSFGSGNKVLHNVVGQFGVLEGNGGDLMTGLPMQSVHDGIRLQHDPLRLLVVIEATRDAVEKIINKHAMVRDLVSNGWLLLTVLEDQQAYRWTSTGAWELESLTVREGAPR
jgi:uncharacterized protein YbcC (UPF0753/DUF2309 family)